MRVGPAIAAIGLAFACGGLGHAAGVFVPAAAPAPPGEREGRFVRIAHDELRRTRAEVGGFGTSRLLFNVGADGRHRHRCCRRLAAGWTGLSAWPTWAASSVRC